MLHDQCAPLASCCYQAGIAFVIASCTPFGYGGVVAEPQVPRGEPAQAFVLFQYHEPVSSRRDATSFHGASSKSR